ncbi:MAG TPA: hypothetical protein ENK19_05510 [Acidobacteria bacterium]|nr:hypothetical protein [Acidobacteriota bacterium]
MVERGQLQGGRDVRDWKPPKMDVGVNARRRQGTGRSDACSAHYPGVEVKNDMMTIEVLEGGDVVEIHADREGAEYLIHVLEGLARNGGHVHLAVPSWAGHELSEERHLSRDTKVPAVRGHPDSRRGPTRCPVAWVWVCRSSCNMTL